MVLRNMYNYDNFPEELQVSLTVLSTVCIQSPRKYFFPVALAIAVFLLLFEDLFDTFQSPLEQVVLTEAEVHTALEPVYENFPETVTDHRTILLFMYDTFLLPDVVLVVRV